MAINRATEYPGRFDNATPQQPEGAFKNRTTEISKDGSYLEKKWLNDFSAFFSSLLSEADVTANGIVDYVGASQYFDALINIVSPTVLITPSAYTTVGDEPNTVLTDLNLPASITNNTGYILTNPFGINEPVLVKHQLLIHGAWTEVGESASATTGDYYGVVSDFAHGRGVLIQTAKTFVSHDDSSVASMHTSTATAGGGIVSAPCRVWITKINKG